MLVNEAATGDSGQNPINLKEAPADFPQQFSPKRAEWVVVFLLLLFGIILNLTTARLYPTVWLDEILWSEPAINLIRTGHFTTSVWQLQPANTFWAAQSPLYPLLMSVWLRFTGFSLEAIRSFNLLLITIGALLSWIALWRFRLVSQSRTRILVLPLIFLGYGISFSYRCSRPDILGMLSLLGLALVFSVRKRGCRELLIVIGSVATSTVGVQVALYAVCVSIIAKLCLRGFSWRETLLVWIGAALGGASVLLFYEAHGSLPYFMATLHQAATEQTNWGDHIHTWIGSLGKRLNGILASYTGDLSAVALIIVLFLAWFWRRHAITSFRRQVLVFLAVIYLLIPTIFSFTGHFAFYYAYLIYLPVVLAILTVYSPSADEISRIPFRRLTRFLFYSAVISAMSAGLPLRLVLGAVFYKTVPRNEYRRVIHAHATLADVAFCDYPGFFEVKQELQHVFAPMYSKHFAELVPSAHEFTTEEKALLTVLIVRPDRLSDYEAYFGGKWKAVSQPFGDTFREERLPKTPVLARVLRRHLESPQMARYQLQVFRRE